jgi:hypothetical protein
MAREVFQQRRKELLMRKAESEGLAVFVGDRLPRLDCKVYII